MSCQSWLIYCIDENKFIEVCGLNPTPTTCPNNVNHIVNPNSACLMDIDDIWIFGESKVQRLPPVFNEATEDGDYPRTEVSTSFYQVLTADVILGVTYTSTGSVAINLPLATDYINRLLFVVDESNNASNNNITVNTSGDDKIKNSLTSLTIKTDGGCLRLYNDGISKWYQII